MESEGMDLEFLLIRAVGIAAHRDLFIKLHPQIDGGWECHAGVYEQIGISGAKVRGRGTGATAPSAMKAALASLEDAE